jgi:hypothetical protein
MCIESASHARQSEIAVRRKALDLVINLHLLHTEPILKLDDNAGNVHGCNLHTYGAAHAQTKAS